MWKEAVVANFRYFENREDWEATKIRSHSSRYSGWSLNHGPLEFDRGADLLTALFTLINAKLK
jgi:hypothetical protein